MIIETPPIFSFEQCYQYIARSNLELTYQVERGKVYKLLEIKGEKYLVSIEPIAAQNLKIHFINQQPTPAIQKNIRQYIWEWFDLDTPLQEFYEAASKDVLLSSIIQGYHGLRLIKIPDLFEAMSWAIIGQQINLNFAYKIKHALIREYGDSLELNEKTYYLFPRPDKIAKLTKEELRRIQFSRQKAEYITLLARSFLNKEVRKKQLSKQNLDKASNQLKKLKGFGDWSAHYVLMRCLGFRSALPIQDAGLKNALKAIYEMDRQPSNTEMLNMTSNWSPWQSYYTFYLWRSLVP